MIPRRVGVLHCWRSARGAGLGSKARVNEGRPAYHGAAVGAPLALQPSRPEGDGGPLRRDPCRFVSGGVVGQCGRRRAWLGPEVLASGADVAASGGRGATLGGLVESAECEAIDGAEVASGHLEDGVEGALVEGKVCSACDGAAVGEVSGCFVA